MTRTCSGNLTQAMREQYEALRHANQRALAEKILEIVGVRSFGNKKYVTTRDIWAAEGELLQLLGEVRTWYTALERQRLYKNSEHTGVSLAKLVLSSVGHPLERSPCRLIGLNNNQMRPTISYKFSLV